MTRFYDIYIRLAGAQITDEDLALGNVLEGFDKLDLPQEGNRFWLEAILLQLGDGTQYVDGEKANVTTGTHRVDVAEYNWLRDTFHNQSCDVLFYDPADNTIMVIVYGVKLNVATTAESGKSAVITLSGSRNWNDANVTYLSDATMELYGNLNGKVYAEDGVTPVEGVEVELVIGGTSFSDTTDKDGEYIIAAPIGEVSFTPTKTGGWVFPEVTVDISKDYETVAAPCVATTDGE